MIRSLPDPKLVGAAPDTRTSLERYRDRDQEQHPTSGVGEPPQHLDAAEAACWREIVALSVSRALTAGDRWRVEMAAKLMVTVRSGEFKDFELRSLNGLLGHMGIATLDGVKPPARNQP